ncbi:hypothetical protein [Saccharothrix coeruleofusca]|uniref:hypothetical protein n=1 Tax=Saccharothrix coeruleofusca TaxID=33919 RepID=UPI00166F98B3|nr:hypothetical protein [Saccharothrix coeruleofusca]
MVIILATPLRTAWSDSSPDRRPSLRELLPAVLSLAFRASLVPLFALRRWQSPFGTATLVAYLLVLVFLVPQAKHAGGRR